MNARRTVSLGALLPCVLEDLQLTPRVAKELRALLPLALVTTLLGLVLLLCVSFLYFVVGWNQSDNDVLVLIPAMGYSVGLVALGATAFGHEYAYRTVGLFLIQPMPREALLRSKLRVLLPVLAVSALPGLGTYLFALDGGVLLLWLAVLLSSVLVAPWLTLLCRSTLAGVVFTFALPSLLLTLVNVVAEFVWPAAESVRLAWSAGLLIGHWMLGGLLGWRKFLRLEAQDGDGRALSLPRVLTRRGRAATREPATAIAPAAVRGQASARVIRVAQSATWMLVKKELRLQPTAWWVAGVFAVLLVGQVWIVGRHAGAGLQYLSLTGWIYVLFVPLLVGSLACAEERQFGTHAWQLTLPVGTTRQWAIKSAVAVGLALLLGLALPMALSNLIKFPILAIGQIGPVVVWDGANVAIAAIVAMTVVGLYASSVSQQSVMALLFALSLAVILPPVLIGLMNLVSSSLDTSRLLTALTGTADLARGTARTIAVAALVCGVCMLVLVLAWLSRRNFGQASVSREERFSQLLVIALSVLMAGIVAGFGGALSSIPNNHQADRNRAAAQAMAGEIATQIPVSTNAAGRFGVREIVRYGFIPTEWARTNLVRPAPPGNQPPAVTNTPTTK